MLTICPCGLSYRETSSAYYPYTVRTFDDKGNVIFAICIHGQVVINEMKNKEEHRERFFMNFRKNQKRR